MNKEFKSGDIVELKSGSPEMTVNSTYLDSVVCQWFTGGKLNSGTFHQDSIIHSVKDETTEIKKAKAK